ncbi:hypothetical protein AMC83_CH01911 [Rhizobium phaseoli]|nr:hypothetical protein AMC83_CH01911 [Rhizobium phaseoli]
MEPVQLSFLIELAPEPPKPPSPWELMAAGLKAQEMKPLTREDVRRARENQGK